MRKYLKEALNVIESMLLSYYAPAPVITHSLDTGNSSNQGMTSINFSSTAIEDNCDY